MVSGDIPHDPVVAPQISHAAPGAAPLSEQVFAQDDIHPAVKEVVLKHLVGDMVRQNESQGIATGVRIVDMRTGRLIFEHNPDTEHFAASINKLPVALTVQDRLRAGHLSLGQVLHWRGSDVREGEGAYDTHDSPKHAPVEALLQDMLDRSGNTAVRALVNYGLNGAHRVNEHWRQYPQLNHTALQPLVDGRFYMGNTTPHDALWTLGQLVQSQDSYATLMARAMANNMYRSFGVRSQLAGNGDITLVNKVGILDDPDGNNRHDVGIIHNGNTYREYGYAFMHTVSPEAGAAATQQAEASLRHMGRHLLRFAGDTPAA